MLAPGSSSGIDPITNPLVYSEEGDRARRPLRRQSVRDVTRFLHRASSRRMMREPSMLVRETAAEQLEERQSDWAYSKPVVILDLIWNLGFVVVVIVVLGLSQHEEPKTWLRLWVVGYAVQCIVHMVCVWSEYKKRVGESGEGREGGNGSSRNGSRYVSLANLTSNDNSMVIKYLESINTVFSFVWWIIGFYWVSSSGQALALDSPKLYWLCVIFLAFDVFFVVLCVALACVIGIAVCCCLPCIIAVLYVVADQWEGASKEDIELLPKFTFRREGFCGGVVAEYGTETPIEHVISREDAECCICLSAYDDGVELRELPCGHHFHCSCIDKWLYINATCPLCKYNIVKNRSHGCDDA